MSENLGTRLFESLATAAVAAGVAVLLNKTLGLPLPRDRYVNQFHHPETLSEAFVAAAAETVMDVVFDCARGVFSSSGLDEAGHKALKEEALEEEEALEDGYHGVVGRVVVGHVMVGTVGAVGMSERGDGYMAGTSMQMSDPAPTANVKTEDANVQTEGSRTQQIKAEDLKIEDVKVEDMTPQNIKVGDMPQRDVKTEDD
ncbi:MAG: hypothetical protein Q9162_005551 [Coniocarpon cinnabarinum]